MKLTRRDSIRLLAVGTIAPLVYRTGVASAAGAPVRLPLHEFVADLDRLKAFRKGVFAMKQRKPSDPLSWFYQAAIHGVTDQMCKAAVVKDPEVANVDSAKYWNQCPHKGENSANFLPWHRGYTYHFEEILRLHVEDESFALPYWDYSIADQRVFPREFGIEHLDGNPDNNDEANINPLFHAERDYFLCGYEHPFTDQLPLTELSSRAADTSRVMNCGFFFGDKESEGVGGGIFDSDSSTRGLLEQSPHDQIHRAVGGNVKGTDGEGNETFAIGGMAVPPTAGFDPIFPVHHANIDRLWAKWACMPSKDWGKLPDPSWFDEKPWYFFDVNGKEVNRPRRDYFDHRALGVAFKDEDPNCQPLELPGAPVVAMVDGAELLQFGSNETLRVGEPIEASTTSTTRIPLVEPAAAGSDSIQGFNSALENVDPTTERVSITIHDARIGTTGSWGFDVFLVEADASTEQLNQDDPRYLGTISLFNHLRGGQLVDQAFELLPALVALDRRSLDGLTLVFVPYALTSSRAETKAPYSIPSGAMTASGFSIVRSTGNTSAGGEKHRH